MFSETMLISTKLLNGLGLTIVGMGVVFTALILISVAIDVLRLVSAGMHKKRINQPQDIKGDPSTQVELQPTSLNDEETLVAVITASVAAVSNTGTENIFVRSIRPRLQNNPIWSSVGRQLQMGDLLSNRGK